MSGKLETSFARAMSETTRQRNTDRTRITQSLFENEFVNSTLGLPIPTNL